MKNASGIKFPNLLNLGTILPGQYGEAILSLSNPEPAFLTLTLTQKTIGNGFFLIKEGSSDCL